MKNVTKVKPKCDKIKMPFTEEAFAKKLLTLRDTQDAIQALSAWCLQYNKNYKKIIHAWLKTLKKGKLLD